MDEEAERYLRLAHKYLSDSDEFMAKEDFVQASEKLWGAAAEMVKLVAAKRDVSLKTHSDFWKFVTELRTELKDPELSRLFHVANNLHQNFYEGILPPEAVMDGAEAVKQLVGKLEKLL